MIEPWRDEKTGNIYCPVNGWDCPHYKNGACICPNVHKECDDFVFFWEDEIEEYEGRVTMTKVDIINKIKEFYEVEYQGTKRVVEASLSGDKQYSWIRSDADRRKAISQTIDRLLGVAFFVQNCDIPYTTIEKLYNEYKGKLENIRVSAS